jgi:hypothetical protein
MYLSQHFERIKAAYELHFHWDLRAGVGDACRMGSGQTGAGVLPASLCWL